MPVERSVSKTSIAPRYIGFVRSLYRESVWGADDEGGMNAGEPGGKGAGDCHDDAEFE